MIRQIVKAGSVLLGSSVVAQALTIVAAPLLTRLYTPTDFGVLATATSIVSILGICATLRLEEIIPLIRSEVQASMAAGVSLFIAGVIGLLSLPVTAVVLKLAGVSPDSVFLAAMVAIPLAVTAAGVFSTLVGVRLRLQQFTTISRTTIDQSIVQLCIQVAGGLLGMGAYALLMGKVAEKGVGIRRLAFINGAVIDRRTVVKAPSNLPIVLKRNGDLIAYGLPAAVIRGSSAAIVAPVLSAVMGVAAAGIYAIAYRALFVPFSLVGSALLRAFLGIGTRLQDDFDAQVKRLVYWSAGVSFVVGSVLFIGLQEYGPSLFAYVFGAQWELAGHLAPSIAVMGVCYAVLQPLQRVYDVWGLVRIRLVLEVLRATGVVTALIVGGSSEWDLSHTVLSVAIVYVTVTVFMVVHMLHTISSRRAG